jgi:hypothetical protein
MNSVTGVVTRTYRWHSLGIGQHDIPEVSDESLAGMGPRTQSS